MNASTTFPFPPLPVSDDNTQTSKPAAPSIDASGESATDEELMNRICHGDVGALALLFHRYARLVRVVAVRILRNDSEADDLMQDVFLFIHRKGKIFDSSKSSARSWIVQMTYQRAIDRRRYLTARHFYAQLNLNDSLDDSGARNDLPGVGDLSETVTVERLFKALSDDQRHTLHLYFYEGYTFDEIATALKQSVRNVRNHYYRGIDKLRKQVFSSKAQAAMDIIKKRP